MAGVDRIGWSRFVCHRSVVSAIHWNIASDEGRRQSSCYNVLPNVPSDRRTIQHSVNASTKHFNLRGNVANQKYAETERIANGISATVVHKRCDRFRYRCNLGVDVGIDDGRSGFPIHAIDIAEIAHIDRFEDRVVSFMFAPSDHIQLFCSR